MSNIKDELQKAESEVKAWFEKIIADIKAKLPAEHHAAVDQVAAEAVAPTPVVVQSQPETTNTGAAEPSTT